MYQGPFFIPNIFQWPLETWLGIEGVIVGIKYYIKITVIRIIIDFTKYSYHVSVARHRRPGIHGEKDYVSL